MASVPDEDRPGYCDPWHPDYPGYHSNAELHGFDPDAEFDFPSVPEILAIDWPDADSAPPPDASLPFPEWLEVQAQTHAALGGTAGAWLAERIREIATTARYVSARTPDEYDARVQVLEWDRDHAIEERGHARGFAMQN